MTAKTMNLPIIGKFDVYILPHQQNGKIQLIYRDGKVHYFIQLQIECEMLEFPIIDGHFKLSK